ncbi:hypothetical protein KGM_211982 [Danaus plexippus plexippus]|uniref:Uncharacterized protein n=1 Tax=Danaus plexippus plexippus TaxID=278856 RepID=A0A212F6F8_DANPL|nr:hypothetical protein KGM_211982 [Danaus plexippus plexippus]
MRTSANEARRPRSWFASKRVQELRTHLASIVLVISQFAELSKLLKSGDLEIYHLKTIVAQLEQDIEAQNPHSLKNELEICVVPELQNENSQKFKVELHEHDIDEVSRVGPKHKKVSTSGRPIVVKLLRKAKSPAILIQTLQDLDKYVGPKLKASSADSEL